MVGVGNSLVELLVAATAAGEVAPDPALGGRARREFGVRKRGEPRAGDDLVQRGSIFQDRFFESRGSGFPCIEMIVSMTAQLVTALEHRRKILRFEHQAG